MRFKEIKIMQRKKNMKKVTKKTLPEEKKAAEM